MKLSEKVSLILSDIEQGKKANINTLQWEDISEDDREYLFSLVQNQWQTDPKGLELLYAIGTLSKKDVESQIKTLELLYVREDVTTGQKENYEKWIKIYLNDLANNDQEIPYNLFSGDLSLIRARKREKSENLERTLSEYKNAIGYYQKAGAQGRVDEVEREMNALLVHKKQGSKPLPIELLLSQRGKVESLLEEAQNKLEQITLRSEQETKDLDRTIKDKEAAQKEWQKIQVEYESLKEKVEKIKLQYPYAKTTLEFLIALSRASTAPLWVEVLRLALQQGEIDDLSIQALERLSIPNSREALPLLIEMAARAPEPFTIERGEIQVGMTKWLSLIADARQEINGKNYTQAANLMLQAWDIFFNEMKARK